VSAGGILLQGGSGDGALAALAANGNLNLNSSALSLVTGSGSGANAALVSINGQLLNLPVGFSLPAAAANPLVLNGAGDIVAVTATGRYAGYQAPAVEAETLPPLPPASDPVQNSVSTAAQIKDQVQSAPNSGAAGEKKKDDLLVEGGDVCQ
jgi:hypothetical protein